MWAQRLALPPASRGFFARDLTWLRCGFLAGTRGGDNTDFMGWWSPFPEGRRGAGLAGSVVSADLAVTFNIVPLVGGGVSRNVIFLLPLSHC